MNQPAADFQPNTTNPQTDQNSPTDPSANFKTEINQLLTAVEKFRQTGEASESDVVFAKEKILPQLGYSNEQINQLNPNQIMVALQEEADKKSLSDKSSESQLATQVKTVTDKLSSEIDSEIKRQLEEKKSLQQAQTKIDTVLAEHENLSANTSLDPNSDSKPEIGLFRTKTEHDQEVNKPIAKTAQPENEVFSTNQLTSADPLTASIASALESLREGDKIGDEWILRKILTTSFGNKKSPFYELVNKSGASWTLSPEEMKEVLRSSIFSGNKTMVGETRADRPEKVHTLGFEKPIENDTSPSPIKSAETNDYPSLPPQPINQIETQIDDQLPEETKQLEIAAEPEIPSSPRPEPVKLSQKQIDFVNKIHTDPNLWASFTSFSPDFWENFNQLYEQGALSEMGINAHPLLDKISNSDNFNVVEIKRDDSSSKILTQAGYDLSSNPDIAPILAIHVIANYKLLIELSSKMKANGLAAANLPSTKDIIALGAKARTGDSQALFKLVESLNFLPVGSKFKVVKADQVDNLLKYFDR